MKIIKITKSHSDLRIQVTGHTDSDGSNTYNKKLSKRRAESIIKFFTKRGLRRDRIVIDFKGESEPIETNQTKDGKRKNRRVDFTFI
jgi:outer membrane protein OmpA-like peptidoglycan-associated protein